MSISTSNLNLFGTIPLQTNGFSNSYNKIDEKGSNGSASSGMNGMTGMSGKVKNGNSVVGMLGIPGISGNGMKNSVDNEDGVGIEEGYLNSMKSANRDVSFGNVISLSNGISKNILNTENNSNSNTDSIHSIIPNSVDNNHSIFQEKELNSKKFNGKLLDSEVLLHSDNDSLNDFHSTSDNQSYEDINVKAVEFFERKIQIEANVIYPNNTKFLRESESFQLPLLISKNEQNIYIINSNDNNIQNIEKKILSLENRNQNNNENETKNTINNEWKDGNKFIFVGDVKTEFKESNTFHLDEQQIPEIIKSGFSISNINQIEGDEQFGIAKLIPEEKSISTTQLIFKFGFEGSIALEEIQIFIESMDIKSKKWKKLLSRQSIIYDKKLLKDGLPSISLTTFLPKLIYESNYKLRFSIYHRDKFIKYIFSDENNNELYWNQLKSDIYFSIEELEQSRLIIESIEEKTLIPFTRFFQSGDRLNLTFALDYSTNIDKNKIKEYENLINSILFQFVPYLNKQSELNIEFIGTKKHISKKFPVENLQENISLEYATSEDWRTFNNIIKNETQNANQRFSEKGDYSILIILTNNGECQLRKTFDSLVNASISPLSVFFVGLGEESNILEIIQREIYSKTRISKSGYFPIERQFCEYLNYSIKKYEDYEFNLSKELFDITLTHIEDFLRYHNINPEPILIDNLIKDKLEQLKKNIKLFKPKIESSSNITNAHPINYQGIPNFQLPPPTIMFQNNLHWNTPLVQPLTQISMAQFPQPIAPPIAQPITQPMTQIQQNPILTQQHHSPMRGTMSENYMEAPQSQYFMPQSQMQQMQHMVQPSSILPMLHPTQNYGISTPSNFVPYPSNNGPFIPFQPFFPTPHTLQPMQASIQPLPQMQNVPIHGTYDQQMLYYSQQGAYQGNISQ